MKLQTSGVLGTSYAIAKLAPKRDGCENNCTLTGAICGNGIIEAGEACDDGNLVNGDGCENNCTLTGAICGNGIIEAGETCDDGKFKGKSRPGSTVFH